MNRVLAFIRQVEHGFVGEILREEIGRLGSAMSVKLTKSSGVFARRRLRSLVIMERDLGADLELGFSVEIQ